MFALEVLSFTFRLQGNKELGVKHLVFCLFIVLGELRRSHTWKENSS